MSFSRRQFIQASGIALCNGALSPGTAAAEKGRALPVPPLLESRRGQPLFLTLQRSHWSFTGDNRNRTPVWSINALYPGPVVRVSRGDDVKLVYSNRLSEPVAISVSGLQVSGPLTGGASRIIAPGEEWAPVLPVRQAAATCWYHATTPRRMAAQTYYGLAGMWIISDEESESSALLPCQYGVDDFPLIIQDKRLDNFGVPVYDPPAHGGFLGDTLLVNGVQDPWVAVPRGWVRLRLVNASSARRYALTTSDNRPFYVIAGDQGLLPAPVAVQQLSLAAGERREVLLDMSSGSEVTISAGSAAGLVERLRGLFEPSTTLISTRVVTLRPGENLPSVTGNLPAQLVSDRLLQSAPVHTRALRLGDASTPGINGALWDMSRIDIQVQQDSTERWLVHADTPQSFHIQGAVFLIKSVNGARPFGEDRGWKDTVWVDGDVELLVFFPQPSTARFPFVYYSQTLEMADRGSAGQLQVTGTE